MNELEKLEKKYNFSYPEIYKRLYADNMLNWGEAVDDWAEKNYTKLAANPPLLFYGNDFDLVHFSIIDNLIADSRNPHGFWGLPPKFNFVPFGQTAAEDLYVFQYDLQNGEDIPVTLLIEDECCGIVQAKNLQDFIFREMLYAATDINDMMPIVTNGDRKNGLNMLRTHSPYLTKEQVDILTDVYNRKIQTIDDDGDPVVQLISETEYNKIVAKVLKFDKLDYEFLFTIDDDFEEE